MGQAQVIACTSCSQNGDEGPGWDVAHWEECVSVAVGGDKDEAICTGMTTALSDYDGLNSPGIDPGNSVPPPLEVPPRFFSTVEPGAPLGAPKAGSPSVVTVLSPADLAAGGAAAQTGLKHNRSVQQLLQAFIKAVGDGVGVSLALEGVGVLVVEARLNLRPLPMLQLRFNCVERVVPLGRVQDVRVERASPEGSGGAWLVRLCLDDDQAFDFVFDGTLEGEREAHYMGGCLRLLVEDAKARPVEAESTRGILSRNSARVVRASSGLAACVALKPLTRPGTRLGVGGERADRGVGRPQATRSSEPAS